MLKSVEGRRRNGAIRGKSRMCGEVPEMLVGGCGGREVVGTWGSHIRCKLSFPECSLLCGNSVGGG